MAPRNVVAPTAGANAQPSIGLGSDMTDAQGLVEIGAQAGRLKG